MKGFIGKYSILILFIFLPRVLYCMKSSEANQDNLDLTKGLNDTEIEMALNDLSLDDLNALSELIDTANNIEANYDENSFLKSNGAKDINLNNENSDNHDYISDDSLIIQPQNEEDILKEFEVESERDKRDNNHHEPALQIDEDYIKQLDFSFPRDIEHIPHENNGLKKDLIRVKRRRTIHFIK